MSMGNDSQPFVFTDDVVNDVIDRLQKENKQLRDKLVELAGRLNAMRADVESTLWPRSGCAQSLYVGGPIYPGTLSIVRSGVTLNDNGGVLENAGNPVGTVDYSNGIVNLYASERGE